MNKLFLIMTVFLVSCYNVNDRDSRYAPQSQKNIISNKDTVRFVYINREGFWAFNDKEKLFKVYNHDNGPDIIRDGLFRIIDEKSGLIGFADLQGKIIIPFQYKRVDPFSEGLAAVCIDCSVEEHDDPKKFTKLLSGAFGFINKSGEIVIKPQFDIVGKFENGRCKVWKDSTLYLINKNGEIIN